MNTTTSEAESGTTTAAHDSAVQIYSVQSSAQRRVRANAEATIMHQFPRAGDVVDIVATDPEVELVRVALGGKRTVVLEDLPPGETFAAHLQSDPYHANAGSYAVVVVRNIAEGPPRQIELAIHVAGETGPEVRGGPLASLIAPSSASGEVADPPPALGEPTPEAQPATASPTPAPAITQPKRPGNRPGRSPRNHERSAALDSQAAAPVLLEGERVAVLSIIQAETLWSCLALRAPIRRGSHVVIAGRLQAALDGIAQAAAPGEVAVALPAEDVLRVLEAVRSHQELRLLETGDVTGIARILARALGRETEEATEEAPAPVIMQNPPLEEDKITPVTETSLDHGDRGNVLPIAGRLTSSDGRSG